MNTTPNLTPTGPFTRFWHRLNRWLLELAHKSPFTKRWVGPKDAP